MSLLRFIATGLFIGFVATAGIACDEGTEPPSGEHPDAGPGGGPPFTQSGSAAYLDLKYVNLPPPFDMLGNGPLTLIGPILNVEDQGPPAYSDIGSSFGCNVFDLTAEQFLSPGINVGAFTFTPLNSDWVTPPCVQIPGVGWACPGAMGTGGDIRVVNAEMGVYSLTDPNAGFAGEDEIGRYVNIMGSATPANNGFHFVVGAPDEDTIFFFNPAPGAEDLNTSGGYATIGGFGPAGRNDPIPDDAALMVSFSPSEDPDNKIDPFTIGPIPFGQSFTLDTATQERISAIPTDGSAFDLSCAGEGGECNTAFATVAVIEGSDGSLAGLPPFLLPNPEERGVRIFCISLSSTVHVPAAASQFLADLQPTRIRAAFARVFPLDTYPGDAYIQLIAGHAQAGFTDPAPPK